MNSVHHVNVRVSRRFSASAERVFDAWLDPEMIGRWMFGPNHREEVVVNITTDAHVGGSFSFVVRRQDVEIDHIGEYLEIERPCRLMFTWAVAPDPIDSSRVVVDIQALKNGCELTLTHELHPDWADFTSQTEEAWVKMLEALEYLT